MMPEGGIPFASSGGISDAAIWVSLYGHGVPCLLGNAALSGIKELMRNKGISHCRHGTPCPYEEDLCLLGNAAGSGIKKLMRNKGFLIADMARHVPTRRIYEHSQADLLGGIKKRDSELKSLF